MSDLYRDPVQAQNGLGLAIRRDRQRLSAAGGGHLAGMTPELHRDELRAAWPLRLWGIRHARWWLCSVRVHYWAITWARHGVGLGWPNAADARYLDAIWRGEK